MNKALIITFSFVSVILLACGSGAKEKKSVLTDKKVRLEKLKKDRSKLDSDIRKLESEIAAADPSAMNLTPRLVSLDSVEKRDFAHYIELQGKIEANDIVIVTPRGMPAQVKQLNVKKGDRVRKGQLLLKLDDAVILQQLDGLNTQLNFARNIYNRQKNLWDQGIGTEVQLITAKNNVDALEKQIATLRESWRTSFVYAPISGIADEVNIKVGEIFSGFNTAGPQLRIINSSNMKAVALIPENYAGRVTQGSKVVVSIPDSKRPPFNTTINVLGSSIDPNTRGFIMEARISPDPLFRVNQLALIKIEDYKVPGAIVIPVNIVQTDEKNKYVYIAEKSGNRMVARKKVIHVGENYEGMIEVKDGLKEGDQIITEGYQTLYDGQVITTVTGSV